MTAHERSRQTEAKLAFLWTLAISLVGLSALCLVAEFSVR